VIDQVHQVAGVIVDFNASCPYQVMISEACLGNEVMALNEQANSLGLAAQSNCFSNDGFDDIAAGQARSYC
jgi:hypothetical protein